MTGPATSAHVVGLDLGGTKVLGRVYPVEAVDASPAHEFRLDTPTGADAVVGVLARAVDMADRWLESTGQTPVMAVGVGSAGLVDAHGVLRFSPNLPGLLDLPLGSRLAATIGRPVALDNDATAATLAEWRLGAGRGMDDLVMVTLGTGIGGGVVSGGRLQRGANGFAGEPGHMVVDPSGPLCPCGRHGCWERYASGSGLAMFATEAVATAAPDDAALLVAQAGGADDVRGEHVAEAARQGDALAIAVLDRLAWWVALGVSNLVDVLDPAAVVIGGGLSGLGNLLLDPVSRAMDGMVLGAGHRDPVPVLLAELGPGAGSTGAALAAAELVTGQR
jgi:glucokinase